MGKLSDKLDKDFSAITFAQSGEFDTARTIANEKDFTDERKGIVVGVRADTPLMKTQTKKGWKKETMADNYSKLKRKPYSKTVLLGAISVAIYFVLLDRQHLINDLFSRGGVYAFLPIITAFLISFVHGGFTGGFWEIIGIEAKKQKR